jgi:hypothetical protein
MAGGWGGRGVDIPAAAVPATCSEQRDIHMKRYLCLLLGTTITSCNAKTLHYIYRQQAKASKGPF